MTETVVVTLVTMSVVGTIALALVVLGRWYVRHVDRQRCLVLELLEQGPAGGLALVKRSAGRLKRGSVYIHLTYLEDKHLVTSTYETGESGRRIYALTDAGARIQQRLAVMP